MLEAEHYELETGEQYVKDLLFEENCVIGTIKQLHMHISTAGYEKYYLLGAGDGGSNIVERLFKIGTFGGELTCAHVNELKPDFLKPLRGKNILICEDTINTGKTIKKILKLLREGVETNDIKILSLTMRQNSPIIPNFYAFELADDNRAYFPWSRYPIRSFLKGIVRKIMADDCEKSFVCGDARIDKTPLLEYYKNQKYKGDRVYLTEENGDICSIIQFNDKTTEHFKGLYLDVIATAEDYKRDGYASTLLRLLTSFAIHHEYDFIEGFAFDTPGVVDMYKRRKFEVLGSTEDRGFGKLHRIVKILNKDHESAILAEI